MKRLFVQLVIVLALVQLSHAKTPKSDIEVTDYDVQHVQQIDCQAIVSDYYDGTRKQVSLCFYEVEIGSCENRQILTMWRKRSGEFGFVGNPKPVDNKCE